MEMVWGNFSPNTNILLFRKNLLILICYFNYILLINASKLTVKKYALLDFQCLIASICLASYLGVNNKMIQSLLLIIHLSKHVVKINDLKFDDLKIRYFHFQPLALSSYFSSDKLFHCIIVDGKSLDVCGLLWSVVFCHGSCSLIKNCGIFNPKFIFREWNDKQKSCPWSLLPLQLDLLLSPSLSWYYCNGIQWLT